MGVAALRAPEGWLGFGTTSKIWSQVLVCRSTAISNTSCNENPSDNKTNRFVGSVYDSCQTLPGPTPVQCSSSF